ncbi:unannotated protein [freshwater metagenome]|uniref:Unannotated protein n=1 Tax=freshwater metagenome TaxID=449393 RepID=A0A6J6QGA0_9ZZZZ
MTYIFLNNILLAPNRVPISYATQRVYYTPIQITTGPLSALPRERRSIDPGRLPTQD